MNHVTLLGRLAREPDVKYTQSGKCVAKIVVAVNRPYKKAEKKEADFIPVVFWGKPAETVGSHFAKGDRILLTGRLQVRSYDKNGVKHWITEVICNDFPEFIETKRTKGDASNGGFERFGTVSQDYDESIPF